MSMTFAEMEEMYKKVVRRFNKIELQEWNAEGAMIELSKQVGELAKQVMIKEKYYALENDVSDVDERLGNEMADVIAQVMRLADFYKIDLEKAFIEAKIILCASGVCAILLLFKPHLVWYNTGRF